MDSSQVQGNVNNNGTGKRVQAEWSDRNHDILVKACFEQVKAGNRPHKHFTKQGWANLIKCFNEQSGSSYEYKQLKNKWDILGKDWTLWSNLIGKETGLGWDDSKHTIGASEEWWAAKIKLYPGVAKFRKRGLKNLEEMELLFKDTVATGSRAWTPSQDTDNESGRGTNGPYTPMTEEHAVEDIGMHEKDCDEDILDMTIDQTPSTQKPKRKRGVKDSKRGSIGHRMCEQFDRIIESMNTEKSVKSTVPTLADCLDMLKKLPGLEYNGETHMIGIRLMKSKSNRETFVLLDDPEVQLHWIKSHTLDDVSRS